MDVILSKGAAITPEESPDFIGRACRFIMCGLLAII
jgi:hypothetical protein